MSNFRHLKPGDEVVRLWQYYTARPPLRYSGIVTEVTEKVVKCKIMTDVFRVMEFDIETGNNVDGREYGWLEWSNEP